MGKVVVNQKRWIESDGKYWIETSVIDRGNLPQKEIFVFTIVDPSQPENDTFTRIAGVYDLLQLKIDRDAAIIDGIELYLRSSFRVNYSSIVQADAAAKTILDTISSLSEDWAVYLDSFATPEEGATYSLPSVDLSLWESLVNSYKSYSQQYSEKLEEIRNLRSQILETQNKLEDISSKKESLEAVVAYWHKLYVSGSGSAEYIYNLYTKSHVLYDAAVSDGNYSSECNNLKPWLDQWDSEVRTTICPSIENYFSSLLQSYETEISSLKEELVSLQSQLIEAEEGAKDLQQKRNQALKDILDIKPDWKED